LDPVILAFLLPTTLKHYCIQIFANLPGSRNSRNKGHMKKTGFTVLQFADNTTSQTIAYIQCFDTVCLVI